jgi:hypothetical protein
MDLKRAEFHNLKQGHHSVSEYIEEFSNLARYAPDDINTDAKRKDKFLKGLNDELIVQLSVAYVPTYQSLCDKAITLENTMKQVENRKRKQNFNKYQSEPSQKMRTFHENSGGHEYHEHGRNNPHHHDQNTNGGYQGNNWGHIGNSNHKHRNGNTNEQRQRNQSQKKDLSQVEYFVCHEKGHYAKDCSVKENDAKKSNENGRINNNGNTDAYKDRRQIQCFNCRNYGYFSNKCPEKNLQRHRVNTRDAI